MLRKSLADVGDLTINVVRVNVDLISPYSMLDLLAVY